MIIIYSKSICRTYIIRLITIALSIISVVCGFCDVVCAYDSVVEEEVIQRYLMTYGFIEGIDHSINKIAQQYPDLTRSAQNAWIEFSSSPLGMGGIAVHQKIISTMSDEALKEFQNIIKESISALGQDVIYREVALEYINTLKRQARDGYNILEPVLLTMLSESPVYQANPLQEYLDGFKKSYSSYNHPKANGLNLVLSYPRSWEQSESNYPNIIQSFSRYYADAFVQCNLLLLDMGYDVSAVINNIGISSLISPTGPLRKMVPDTSALLESKTMVLEQQPCVMMVYDITNQRLDTTITMRSTQYILFYKNNMINIGCLVMPLDGDTSKLVNLQDKYYPVFQKIAASFVINDLYKR